MILGPALLPSVLIAAVLVVSGLAKLRHTTATRSAFQQLKMPRWMTTSFLPAALAPGELLLAVAVLVLPGWAGVAAAVAALLLVLAYVIVIARALTFPVRPSCGCFGELGMGEVTGLTLVRNIVLAVIAALAVWASVASDDSIVQRLIQAPAESWLWLLGVAVAVVLAGLIVHRPAPDFMSMFQPAVADAAALDEDEYLRAPIPFATLLNSSGDEVQLRDMARRQAQLIVYLSPGCGTCHWVFGELDQWRTAIDPVALRVLYSMEPDSAREVQVAGVADTLDDALFDPKMSLVRMMGLSSPSAFLLGTDDLLAGGPVRGEDVRELVNDVAAQLEEARQGQE
ncbi:MauE/DoxX family redox-associated membrane protein [Aestuariimicrobium ganziense]|uniref:MauE/DoxX family redox-associated membrane protein n=1 Tax=Aestuariimicrobium ganziense TaxID=2773677 RepID=UPI001945AA38|nr:MauE/DoxX family redox-associated membrane protein [Aestuariimicrobium ganziense]